MGDSSFRVMVIGGGIGGLCLAQGLKKAGVSVSLFERDQAPTSRLQGYRIHVSPAGASSLRECLPENLWTAFEASCGRAPHSFRFLTHRMQELLRVATPGDAPGGRHYSASRARLRQVLLEGLDGILHFDRAFSRYEEEPDGPIHVFFDDGQTDVGDVLVGADGGKSRVRSQLLPGAQRVDTGIRAIGGKVILTDEVRSKLPPALLEGPALVRAPGGRAMFLAVQEIGDPEGSVPAAGAALRFEDESNYLMWALSARDNRSGFPSTNGEMSDEELQAFTLRACSGWHPGFSAMIQSSDPASLSVITVRTSVPVSPWPTGRVTLIGDAIHSMTPYRGIGGNVALRDAALLSRKLAAAHRGEIPLSLAIRDYESAMLDYGFRAVRSSLRAAEQAHSPGALAFHIGNLAFRALNAIPPLKASILRRGDAD